MTVGLLVAITLVPAILAIIGDRVFWPPRVPCRRARWRRCRRLRVPALAPPTWAPSPAAEGRRRRSVAGRCRAGLGGRAGAQLSIGSSFVSSLPGDSSVRVAAASAQEGFAEGILSPTTVLLEGERLDRQRRP